MNGIDLTSALKNHPRSALCGLLAVLTFAVYWPALNNGFVNLDDPIYITENPHVTGGLTLSGVAWAFSSGYACNWHPLTWLSHMLDCQIFGLSPHGHHFINVLFHIANSLLVFLLLNQMTGSRWRSAFVAALFAWHPLHVESVAWASERKDVLSTCFGLLTMMAYARYAALFETRTTSKKKWYGLVLLCFALGLMGKPMLVTLPCVLLLIDFWPLNRRTTPWAQLFIEKAPFFLLAFAASVITYLVQQSGGAMASFENVPFSSRAANAVVAYVKYLEMTFWPSGLAAFYPFAKAPSLGLTVISVGLLAVVSAICLLAGRRRPYLLTGWFWFVGTLVPTIGLVQVGAQSLADRYMYIPSIGLFVLVVWGLHDLCSPLPNRRVVLGAAGSLVLAACLACTWRQVHFWRGSEQLFQHAIQVTQNNYVAYNGLGGVLDQAGRPRDAMAAYLKAVEINPRYPEGQYNLGTALLNEGRLDEALAHLIAALKSNPLYVPAHNNLGKTLLLQGRIEEAGAHLATAVELNPEYPQAHYNFGTFLLQQSRVKEALEHFLKAVQLKPDYAEAQGNLGVTLMQQGRAAEGIARFREASRLKPNDPGSHSNLGLALLEINQPAEAAAEFEAALRLNSADPALHFHLGRALASQRKSREAAAEYRAALQLKPDFAEALQKLAWLLSTDSKPELRDGREAVRLAGFACDLSHQQRADFLLTLANGFAETGDFVEAVKTAQKARELAVSAGQQSLVVRSDELMKLYQAGRPFHESE